jgi:hypothetical protein
MNEQVRQVAKNNLLLAYEQFTLSRQWIRKEFENQSLRPAITAPLLTAMNDIDQKIKTAVAASPSSSTLVITPLTNKQLDVEMNSIFGVFKGKETEENWLQRENGLKWIQNYFFQNASRAEEFIGFERGFSDAALISVSYLLLLLFYDVKEN